MNTQESAKFEMSGWFSVASAARTDSQGPAASPACCGPEGVVPQTHMDECRPHFQAGGLPSSPSPSPGPGPAVLRKHSAAEKGGNKETRRCIYSHPCHLNLLGTVIGTEEGTDCNLNNNKNIGSSIPMTRKF